MHSPSPTCRERLFSLVVYPTDVTEIDRDPNFAPEGTFKADLLLGGREPGTLRRLVRRSICPPLGERLRDNAGMSQALRLRPRLIWLLVTPVIFAWSAYGAATASGGERLPALAIAISSLLWALYLWVTRIELENGGLAVKRLGEVKSSVRLDALKSWDSYWGGHIPTPTLVIEDTDGNVISLDGLWWAKWSGAQGTGCRTKCS